MEYLTKFIMSEGDRYQELVLGREHLGISQAPGAHRTGLDGWSFMMMTPGKEIAMLYFENKSVRTKLLDMKPNRTYSLRWYDPRLGEWLVPVQLKADAKGVIEMPLFPGQLDKAQTDWAAKLNIQ